MLARASLIMAVLLSFLALSSCSKSAPVPTSTVLPSDRVAPSPVGTSQTVLQKTFNLKDSETFPFEIPAHASQPHLHGIFESFLGKVHGVSDESSNIDFLIMNEEQESALLANRASEALFSVESSHNQAVNFDLPASMNHPVKYYLVFRSSEKSKNSKVVEANFRVDF
ncbi:MAG TPA: hypothetical protein VMH04_17795 [Candidatus Solibacter sp.]|nr:hypothetical protein [Candidatus Solibacter sp.]